MWDLAVDIPTESVDSLAIGIPELRYNRIPCIVKANKQSSKAIPYLIRYNNDSQIGTAVDEALIMDRTYIPPTNHITWEETVNFLLQKISDIESERNIVLSYDYLPLSDLISLAEESPPNMAEIKKQVQDAFSKEGLVIYRDLIWTLDYLNSNQEKKYLGTKIMIGII